MHEQTSTQNRKIFPSISSTQLSSAFFEVLTRITIILTVVAENCWLKGTETKTFTTVPLLKITCTTSMLDAERTDGKTMKF